jgi:hypothetical protein
MIPKMMTSSHSGILNQTQNPPRLASGKSRIPQS